MTREERIKLHQERIEKIIQESRAKREAEQKAAAAAAAAAGQPPGTPAPGASPTPAAGPAGNYPNANPQAQPGAALPVGPVQTFAPPVQQAGAPTKAPQAASGARSESRTMLLFHPMDSVVDVGDAFETEVIAETRDGSIDMVSFLIRYPKDYLNPLALDHSALDPLVKDELQYSFDPEAGEIYLKAPLKEAKRLSGQPLARIIWEALRPTDGVNITYAFDKKLPTGLFLKGTNLLGTLPGSEDGIIKSSVMIRGPKSRPVIQAAANKGLLITNENLAPPAPIIQLHLDPQTKTALAGETFDVDVVVNNPGDAPFDRVRLAARFDPRDVEVLDYDQGNIIRRGINIQDAGLEGEFRFDFVRENAADNAAGFISFDAGTELAPMHGSGTVATIRFRAKRAVASTRIELVTGDRDTGKFTDVTNSGSTMLAGLPIRTGVLDDVAVRIAQAPAGARPLPAATNKANSPFRSRLGNTVTE